MEPQGCRMWIMGTRGSDAGINVGSQELKSQGSCSEDVPASPPPPAQALGLYTHSLGNSELQVSEAHHRRR